MTFKKNKRPPRRIRLSSFQRALRDAELRLEKATLEHAHCLEKLAELNIEIPYLEGILRALTPQDDADDQPLNRQHRTSQRDFLVDTRPQSSQPTTPPPDLLGTETLDPADQAQFLARFMPRPGRTTATHPGPLHSAPLAATIPQAGASDDPDEFLKDDGPGRPILD